MNNELFTVRPNLKQFYGRTVTKDMCFDESTDNGEVHQILENCVLTTEINKVWEQAGIKNEYHSVQKETLPEGTVLIWSEEQGYIVPNVAVCKLKDIEDDIKAVKEAYRDNTDINPCG